MRIAFLDSWHTDGVEGSGTGAAIGGLAQALGARGHHVTRLRPTAAWPRTLTLRRLLYNVQLPALLPTLGYDLVVGFDIDGFVWAGRAGSLPYVCSIKGVLAEEMQHEQGRARWLLWFLSRLERHNARRAWLVLTDSNYSRRTISRHYGVPDARIRLVPEGIDLRGWQHDLARLPDSRDPFLVLCVARHYPRKHIADLLHAFAQVNAREPRARLTIVGEGPEYMRLRQLAHRLNLDTVVHFTGGLPAQRDVLAWYRRSAIFCMPSVQEGFGIVFLEAMASGLPVVGTTAAAVPEVVPRRQVGILVPPANPSALAEALGELLANPALCRRYGAAGQEHVQQFTWERVAEQFLAAVQPIG